MDELICANVSVYGGALTRGKRYAVLAADPAKGQVRVKGDNGRCRWFPLSCFVQGDQHVPTLDEYHLDDPLEPGTDSTVEVTVRLSDGEERWCAFATPAALGRSGSWVEGTRVPFRYGNRHLIIAGELSEELIGRMLRYIDSQGALTECSLPLESPDDE